MSFRVRFSIYLRLCNELRVNLNKNYFTSILNRCHLLSHLLKYFDSLYIDPDKEILFA